eukprot:999308-Prymnesium_polylepis.2
MYGTLKFFISICPIPIPDPSLPRAPSRPCLVHIPAATSATSPVPAASQPRLKAASQPRPSRVPTASPRASQT